MSEHDGTRSAPVPLTATHDGAAHTASRAPGTFAQTPDEAATSAIASGDEFPSIPGYEILAKLGEGGMGVVYRAKQLGLNRDVAIKTLIGPTVSHGTLARFWAEAQVMAEVKHPNVVQVIELGETVGRPFIAMEFVGGGSLADRLRSGVQLPPTEAAELMVQVARGVAAAHDLGIVHRDLKPDNVLMDGAVPKVADFGIAKRKAHDLTQTNVTMGTPAYMSPEQAVGKTKFVGPAADVWSLGVMLYECLAGRRPFTGDGVKAVLIEIAFGEAPVLRTAAPGVPRDLETIVAKCLTKESELRYGSANELADDLGRFAHGEPIAARPVRVAERMVRWVHRKPTAAAAWGFSALATALAVVVLVVFGFWREAERAKRIAEAAQEKVAVVEYARTIHAAYQEWRENNIPGVRALLDSTAPHLRGGEWRYVDRLCSAPLLTLKGHTGEVRSASFSADGTRVVTGSQDGTAKVWDAGIGNEVRTLKGHTSFVHSASFSADGSRIVTASADNTAKVWDAKTGKELAVLQGHTGYVESASFSADGTRVVTGGWDKTARVWDAKTGAEVFTLKGHTEIVYSASFSPDGSRVVTGGRDGTAKVWNPLHREFLPK